MRRLAVITQPAYLPRLYLWNRFLSADVIVWLDDVAYQRTWQNAIVVKLQGKVHRLTVPVHGSQNTLLKDVTIDNTQKWVQKHLKTLKYAYQSCPHYEEAIAVIAPLLEDPPTGLVGFNLALLRDILSHLGVDVEQHRSSVFQITSTSMQRLVDLCHAVGAEAYLCGASGVRDYLDVEQMAEKGIEVRLQGWKPPEYPQMGNIFEPNLSIVDLLVNVGFDATGDLLR